MRYDSPQLAERLAVDYVLGQMPPRAQRRFERAAAEHATLAATVGAWSEQLAPLDAVTADETPPAHVWRRIERRLGGRRVGPVPVGRQIRARLLPRVFAAAAIAACVVLATSAVLDPAPLRGAVDALAERIGLRQWVVSAEHAPAADIGLSTMRLGVAERERPRWIRAGLLVSDEALPITAEQPPPPPPR
jgi:hypothetical protein